MRSRLRDLRRDVAQQLDAVSLRLWEWDHRCLEAMCWHPRLRRFSKMFVAATYFGDGYLWLIVGLGLVALGTSLDRLRVATMAIITCINIVTFRLSKRLTKRDRPGPLPATRDLRFRYLDSYSFPSGHATTSFGIAFMIAQFYPALPVQLAAFGASTLIAFSRVYVGEHYPSDVVSGALLGVLLSALLLPLLGGLLH